MVEEGTDVGGNREVGKALGTGAEEGGNVAIDVPILFGGSE